MLLCFPRVTRYASGNSIHIQGRITTNIRKQNFAYRAAQNWNSLLSDIRLTDKLCVFPRRLKIWVKDNEESFIAAVESPIVKKSSFT